MTPAAVKATYRNASIVGHDRAVFNFKANACRLVVKIQYGLGTARYWYAIRDT